MAERIDLRWEELMVRNDFRAFVQECRSFDPVGFDRALKDDLDRGCDVFRLAVIDVFQNVQFATASELH